MTYAPRVVCFNGKGVYAWYSGRPTVTLGPQDETIGQARVFVVPSTSGRNGSVRRVEKATFFCTLRDFVAQQTGRAQ
jgi:TDG/mug DNA glycosylase family protein